MLLPPDRKVLKKLRKVQGSELNFVVLQDAVAFPAESWESAYVNQALKENGTEINSGESPLSSCIDSLIRSGCLERAPGGPALQVTHFGWYADCVQRAEWFKLLLTHVAFPALVSFTTTLLTLFLMN